MIQKNGKVSCTHGLEEIILLKCPYYPMQCIDLMQYLSNTNDIFHGTRTNNLKIYRTTNDPEEPKQY